MSHIFKQASSPHKVRFIEPYAHHIELNVSEYHIHDNIMKTDSTQLIRYEEKLRLNEWLSQKTTNFQIPP